MSRPSLRISSFSKVSKAVILLSLVVLGLQFLSLVLASGAPVRSVMSGCDILTPSSVPPIGLSGTIRFDCQGSAAFSATGNATPTFNIVSTGYASLAIVLHSAKGCDQPRPLRSGVTVSFGGSKSGYDYCASIVDPSIVKLGQFKITWTAGRTI